MAIKDTTQEMNELDLETQLWVTKPFNAILDAKWLIFALVVGSIITSLVISNMLEPTYRATATISLSASVQKVLGQPAVINQIADSDEFLADVAAVTKPDYTPNELRDQISAVQTAGANTISIQATDSGGGRAKVLANAGAEAFLARTEPLELMKVKENKLKLVQAAKIADDASGLVNLDDVDKELAGLKSELPTIEQSALSESELATYALGLQSRIHVLEQRKLSLLSEMVDEGQTLILAPAVRPHTPIAPNIPRNVIFSAISALIVGITLAITFRPSRSAKSS